MVLCRGGRIVNMFLAACSAFMLLSVGSPEKCSAQSSDAQRRQRLADGLTETLIDTDFRPVGIPRVAARSGQERRLPVDLPSADLLRVREVAAALSREAARLSQELDRESDRVPGVRPYLGHALQIRASASVFAQQTTRTADSAAISAEFSTLDRDWRLLAYRLRQIRELGSRASAIIQEIDKLDEEIAGRLRIEPQLNRRELIRHTAELDADLSNLIDDLSIELESSPLRVELLATGRRVQEQARYMSNTIQDYGDYKSIVQEYQRFQTMWNPFAAKLRTIDNRYVQRSVRRIRHVNHDLHELMWMPRQIDRDQLLHLTGLLTKDVDEFFVRAPLRLMIELPRANEALPSANAFYGVFEHFTDCVSSGDEYQDLVAAYGYIDEQWKSFRDVFRPLNSKMAQHVLNEIEHSIVSLREALLINVGFDRRVAVDMSSSLSNLAEHLDRDVKLWMSHYRPEQRGTVLRESSAFVTATRAFHESVVSGSSRDQLQQSSAELYESWRKLYAYVQKCTTDEKIPLQRVASQISPAVVELRTMALR